MARRRFLAVMEVELEDDRLFTGFTLGDEGGLVEAPASSWVEMWLGSKLQPEGEDYQNENGAEGRVIDVKELPG